MTTDLVAAACLALAVGLWSPSTRSHRLRQPARPSGRPRVGARVAVASLAIAIPVVAGRPDLAPAFGAAAAGVTGRVVRNRAVRRADALRRAVPEFAGALAGELRAGRAPGPALEAAAAAAPDALVPLLAPARAAAELGADVPAALRVAALTAGADGLRRVAACWAVADGVGAPAGTAIARVAAAERAEVDARATVDAELAGVRATALLLAMLPLLGLVLGTGLGASPWDFLLGTPAGSGCLAVGVGLQLAGLAWTERLASRALAGT